VECVRVEASAHPGDQHDRDVLVEGGGHPHRIVVCRNLRGVKSLPDLLSCSDVSRRA
jgi:hypothetical protein